MSISLAVRKTNSLRTLFLFLVLLIASFAAKATHIRAGEIRVELIDENSRTYRFIFVGYRDTESGILFGGGIFDFGDGSDALRLSREVDLQSAQNISPVLVREEFEIVHSYSAPGTYTVSYTEENRNARIANMSNSVSTPFHVESQFQIDPIIGANNSPILTVPPVDDGLFGVSFIHNPGAFDPDGDSLSYRLILPEQDRDLEVADYQFPNDPEFYLNSFNTANEAGTAPPSFSINTNGDLIWDAPGNFFNLDGTECPPGSDNCAEYNVAIIIEEWRNVGDSALRVGFVVRDMQIVISDGDNQKPELQIPDPICVEAGTEVMESIFGSDPDNHQVFLEAFGGPFEINAPATYTPEETLDDATLRPIPPYLQPSPGELIFNWSTVCGHVRALPYSVQFKVTDFPFVQVGNQLRPIGPTLVDLDSWEITVVGPAPQGVAASAVSSTATSLSWEPYSCPNAETIQIWRRVGEFPFEADDCLVGIPDSSGYELIANIGLDSADQNPSFLDNDGGSGLTPGAKYCYRLVATFPSPGGGVSYASEEVCVIMAPQGPVITNVDVAATSEEGEIIVQWTPPIGVNPDQFPPPYAYNLFRLDNPNFEGEPLLVESNITDTFFIDTGINTFLRGFSYQVALFDANNTFVDTSAHASSVRLELEPAIGGIGMGWSADVPWSLNIPEYPFHYIYRDNVLEEDLTELVLIDSVAIAPEGFFYFDDGRFNSDSLQEDREYCYFVTTLGSYDNQPTIPEPLINRTQIQCAQPRDTVPPCQPLALRLNEEFECESVFARIPQGSGTFNDFRNEIFWEIDESQACEASDLVGYNIYFSPTGLDEDYELIANVIDLFFLHEGLTSFKGCYRVAALDRSGNESILSEEVCADNCPNFVLPNVFTPNNDGRNDFFTPFFSSASAPIPEFDNSNCPLFVERVVLSIFDRNGKTLFDYDSQEDTESGILINWDGRTNDGRELPAGVYFYSAEVTFDVLETSDDQELFNGWVQILK